MKTDREADKRLQKGSPPESGTISPDDIAVRAFEIHLRQGGAHGRDLADWFQAERELREEREKSSQ